MVPVAATAPAFYHMLRDSQRLLLTRDEVRWAPQLTETPQPVDVVVNFGCGQQLTPHLMLEAVDVLGALGVRVAAVAGPQWCCGMPVEEDEVGGGTQVVRASVRRISRFQPRTSVQVCGAWWPQTETLRDLGEVVPFDLAHMAQFVMHALERRLDDIEWRDTTTTRVLVHLKAHELSPEMLAERAASMAGTDGCVPAILRMIPTVDIVGDVVAPTMGAPCATGEDDRSVLSDLSPEQLEQVRTELADQADRTGASLLACAHHQCFREWGKFAGDRLPVRHYISVLADAMGLARPNRYHTCWALPTVDDIVEETAPAWRSWGMTRAEAVTAAGQIFPSHPLAAS
jgi:hypothetical protein